jgi:hypothetical protein
MPYVPPHLRAQPGHDGRDTRAPSKSLSELASNPVRLTGAASRHCPAGALPALASRCNQSMRHHQLAARRIGMSPGGSARRPLSVDGVASLSIYPSPPGEAAEVWLTCRCPRPHQARSRRTAPLPAPATSGRRGRSCARAARRRPRRTSVSCPAAARSPPERTCPEARVSIRRGWSMRWRTPEGGPTRWPPPISVTGSGGTDSTRVPRGWRCSEAWCAHPLIPPPAPPRPLPASQPVAAALGDHALAR